MLPVRRRKPQLAQLGEQEGVDTVPIVSGQLPVDITRRAHQMARLAGYDVLVLDTAGRLHVDTALMGEVAAIAEIAAPNEVLLVADAMAGQDAVQTATAFGETLALSGVILTRLDGDARGGAALSMRAVTGCPIKFVGVGERIEDMAPFVPARIARQVLGMGDVVSLVEKARAALSDQEAQRIEQNLKRGQFDLDDMAQQLGQLRKMGGMSGVLAMMPGMGKLKEQMKASRMDDGVIGRQQAILASMTPYERAHPKVIHASRKKRIATGSGTGVNEVNKLLKQYQTMAKMMKRAGKMDRRDLEQKMGTMFGGGTPRGGTPPL